jgi:hypothetical protein
MIKYFLSLVYLFCLQSAASPSVQTTADTDGSLKQESAFLHGSQDLTSHESALSEAVTSKPPPPPLQIINPDLLSNDFDNESYGFFIEIDPKDNTGYVESGYDHSNPVAALNYLSNGYNFNGYSVNPMEEECVHAVRALAEFANRISKEFEPQHLDSLEWQFNNLYGQLAHDELNELERTSLISTALALIRIGNSIPSMWCINIILLVQKSGPLSTLEMYNFAEALIYTFEVFSKNETEFICLNSWWEKYIALLDIFSDFWDDFIQWTIITDSAEILYSDSGHLLHLLMSSAPLFKALIQSARAQEYNDYMVTASLIALSDFKVAHVCNELDIVLRRIHDSFASASSISEVLESRIVSQFASCPASYLDLLFQLALQERYYVLALFVKHINHETFSHCAFMSRLAQNYSETLLGADKSWDLFIQIMERAPLSSEEFGDIMSEIMADEFLNEETIDDMRIFVWEH